MSGPVTSCAHLLCADTATHFERITSRNVRPLCRAHHLEFRWLQHVERVRAAYKPRQRVVMPCGTPAAAARHRRRGEPVCDPCRIADNARTTAFKAKRREMAS